MILTIPARLIAAHIIGDFVLQPDKWVEDRTRKNFGSPYLYLHALLQGILAWAAVFTMAAWWVGVAVSLGHLLFDGEKQR